MRSVLVKVIIREDCEGVPTNELVASLIPDKNGVADIVVMPDLPDSDCHFQDENGRWMWAYSESLINRWLNGRYENE